MSMLDKLKEFLAKSPDKTKQGIDKAASFADQKTGGKYSDKIDQFSGKAHGYVDAQNQQDSQNQDAQNQQDRPQQGNEQQGGSAGSGSGGPVG